MQIVKVLSAIWQFFDGKKLVIGATMVALSQFIGGLETSWSYHTPFLDGSVTFLLDWGNKIGATGLAFKGVKVLQANSTAPPTA